MSRALIFPLPKIQKRKKKTKNKKTKNKKQKNKESNGEKEGNWTKKEKGDPSFLILQAAVIHFITTEYIQHVIPENHKWPESTWMKLISTEKLQIHLPGSFVKRLSIPNSKVKVPPPAVDVI